MTLPELISVMSFLSKNKEDYKLIRYCSKIGFYIPDAFKKLLNFFIENNKYNIIKTSLDCRFFGINKEDNICSNYGFDFLKALFPNYWYLKKGNYLTRSHKSNFKKKISYKTIKYAG